MATTISVAELQRAGVALRAEEAVAIAQKLIHEPRPARLIPPLGPPSADNVNISDDGSVTCGGCEATPGVAEIAILLQSLLPEGGATASGSLRYAIARALHEVDAPPFDSLEALSAALSRHERGDRDRVIQQLFARAAGRDSAGGRVHERRRTGRAAEYRRHLREADERLYRQKLELEAVSPSAAPPEPRRRRVTTAVVAALLGLLAVGAVETLRVDEPAAVAAPAPASPAWTRTDPAIINDHKAAEPSRIAVRRAQRPVRTAPPAPPRNRHKIAAVLFGHFRVVDDFQKR